VNINSSRFPSFPSVSIIEAEMVSAIATVILVLAALKPTIQTTPSLSVSRILQDVSFISTYKRLPHSSDNYEHRVSVHLRYVHDLLLKSNVCHLSPSQLQNRKSNLANLTSYIERGEYPQHQICHNQTRPRFRDHRGVLCAVGYLIATSTVEGEKIVDDVNNKLQYAYIEEMIQTPRIGWIIQEWASKNGFSVEELAMIQPSYGTLTA
jgi:hypothetical protein